VLHSLRFPAAPLWKIPTTSADHDSRLPPGTGIRPIPSLAHRAATAFLAIAVRCFGVIGAATGSASQTLLHVFCTSRKFIKTVGTEVSEVGFGRGLSCA
jgi:hypothetical protein